MQNLFFTHSHTKLQLHLQVVYDLSLSITSCIDCNYWSLFQVRSSIIKYLVAKTMSTMH